VGGGEVAAAHRAASFSPLLSSPPPHPLPPSLFVPPSPPTRAPQMVGMASQMGIGMWVNAFFTGFLTLRLPFSLTERFKSLTQGGIGVPGLDTSYVSSTSWFIAAQFGLGPLFRLFARFGGGSSAEEQRALQMQLAGGMMMPGMPGAGNAAGPWQPKTAFKNELAALETAEWNPAPLLAAEAELLAEAEALGLVAAGSSGARPTAAAAAAAAAGGPVVGAAPAIAGGVKGGKTE
jgi:hypothetical protein